MFQNLAFHKEEGRGSRDLDLKEKVKEESEYSKNYVRSLMLQVVHGMKEPTMNIREGEKEEEGRHRILKKSLSLFKTLYPDADGTLKVLVMEELEHYLWGYYVLDDLINDPEVSDIRVLHDQYIRYKKKGRRYLSEDHFIDANDYQNYVSLLALRNKKSLSDVNAITYFTDTSNPKFILRCNICTNLVAAGDSPILTIRKIPKEKYTLEDLIRQGMLTPQVASYLVHKVGSASGILFTGKGASGKTTLMNTLLEYIPDEKSAVVIQESDELFIRSKDTPRGKVPGKDIAFLHTISYHGESKVEYDLSDLARNGLRMDLDYYIIGEIKGPEAEGFSMASFTGHQCWATVHGMNSYEAMNKLADYIKQATGYEFEDCLRKLIGMEVVVFMKDFKVAEITEICGFMEEQKDLKKRLIYQDGVWYE